ncbi:MAG: hypothetical protein R2769_01400 [Saprospiraceae bacterium]
MALDWFSNREWTVSLFKRSLGSHENGLSGIVNAPPEVENLFPFGSFYSGYPSKKSSGQEDLGLHTIWISPIRALTKEIQKAGERFRSGLELDCDIAVRSGDTSSSERQKIKKNLRIF